MKITLPDFDNANVLVVGDVMLDRYWHGPTERVSPEAPVPIVKVKQIEDRPGGAANVALNVAALGGKAKLIGLTGQDEAADILAKQLASMHIATDFARQAERPTITKLRVLSRHQQLIRLDFEESFLADDSQALVERVAANMDYAPVVVFSDYAKGALTDVAQMIALAKSQGMKILIDPKGNDFEKYRGADLLTPNFGEFEAVAGPCHSEEQIIEKALEMLTKYDLAALLITRSEHGMTLVQADKTTLHLPAKAKEVFDVTGAGDTVVSVLAAALSAGADLATSCTLANAAAGVVVGKLGTSTVSLVELANAVHSQQELGFGVVGPAALKLAVAAAKSRGETVVMTNGCFDILHAGHVSYLNSARELGHRLIVAVNTDASVRALKGEGRPVNSVERRMAVLAGLGAVDWVVPFSEDTPQQLIADILPDILVKGGDYTVEQIAGGAEVLANGGEVKVLQFEDGCSTTEIIKTIRNERS
ncbi:bifunctional D-glycero-beta-D-manno-heptose-7-phosphate kinase/D-glycero-beta-D-manno-heptose 1-phosphate adenylyltransferase HldE [Motilimonas sp. KMU-193]|uniref:bifunctional D-glycero-beta-D-manno-heptose-7-phosphate kinase/D-glycero-beta-D-manno-heptose 1-phosphate adenylyltransferase HldE n=1 Tax=Motilimonas sp. KMU-193 TaxID=3388668 RepID=UPI00396B3DF3